METLKRLILCLEDNGEPESLSLKALKECGIPCDIKVISVGAEALGVLFASNTGAPDLVVLDFHLPGYDGLEFIRELRRNENTRHVPIVLLSSMGREGAISEYIADGANSCVEKPADPVVYLERVALVVRYWLTVDRRHE
jgi:CheY-like chemotaxis protein